MPRRASGELSGLSPVLIVSFGVQASPLNPAEVLRRADGDRTRATSRVSGGEEPGVPRKAWVRTHFVVEEEDAIQ